MEHLRLAMRAIFRVSRVDHDESENRAESLALKYWYYPRHVKMLFSLRYKIIDLNAGLRKEIMPVIHTAQNKMHIND